MNRSRLPVIAASLGLSFVVACRSGGSNTNNNQPDGSVGPGSDSGGPTSMHIQDVQSDTLAPGSAVQLHGVVVTAIDTFGTRNGQDMWVEEPGGGPYSGVHVFRPPLSALANLAPGDIVDITGAVKSEFIINGDTSGRSLTEVAAPSGGTMTITKTGTGAVPAPAVVDALAIGVKATQSERDAEWEKWEGVLITSSNVAAAGTPACIKSKGVCTDVDSVSITGVAKMQSGLAAFPAIENGDCFASVTGVVDYAFDYVVYPRATAEIVTGGTGCVREIATGAVNLCTDTVDNDGNGFSDCKDFSCEVGPGAWLGASCTAADATCGCSVNLATAVGVNKVNTGTTGAVLLHDVLVTAVGPKGFWIADAAQAVTNGGVFVFMNATPDASVVVGANLATVQGIAGPFGTGTQKVVEISRPTVGAATAGAQPLPITGATVSQVADIANGGPYAGSLVQLGPLKVTVAADANNRVTLTDNSGNKITMDDGAFLNYGGAAPVLDLSVGTCFATVTGVMDLQTIDQIRTINPRSAADVVLAAAATDCK